MLQGVNPVEHCLAIVLQRVRGRREISLLGRVRRGRVARVRQHEARRCTAQQSAAVVHAQQSAAAFARPRAQRRRCESELPSTGVMTALLGRHPTLLYL